MILYIYINAIDITTSVVAHESMITILKFQLLNTLSLSLSHAPMHLLPNHMQPTTSCVCVCVFFIGYKYLQSLLQWSTLANHAS
jgi:hypothetical protein